MHFESHFAFQNSKNYIIFLRKPEEILGFTSKFRLGQGCILAGISFLSISSILLPTRKSGIRRDKYLSAAIFKEAVHSDDS